MFRLESKHLKKLFLCLKKIIFKAKSLLLFSIFFEKIKLIIGCQFLETMKIESFIQLAKLKGVKRKNQRKSQDN